MKTLFRLINHPPVLSLLLVLCCLNVHAATERAELSEIGRGTLVARVSDGELDALPLLETRVRIEVTGQIARTYLTQQFKNSGDSWTEALYLFPLPHDAAVDHLRMTIGDRLVEGQVQEREQAKTTYQRAKSNGQRAALVEQDRPNLFHTSVANIPPHGDAIIQLEYQQSVEWRDGVFSLRFPMAITPRFRPGTPAVAMMQQSSTLQAGWELLPGERPQMIPLESIDNTPENPTQIEVVLRPGIPIEQIQSLNHAIGKEALSDGNYRLTLDGNYTRADQDFVLQWQAADQNSPRAAFFSESSQLGHYGLLTLMPPTIDGWEAPPREVIFVIDTSGSMDGRSIRAAKRALLKGLDGLGAADTFNLIEFNDEATALFSEPMAAVGNALRMADTFVQRLIADGGTDIERALDLALRMKGDRHRLQQVFFITDGGVSNEQQLFQQIHRLLGERRLFTVGIGSAPNSYFMTESARAGRGTYTYIGDAAHAEAEMSALFEKVAKASLTDIKVKGFGVTDITPQSIPDLYAGEPITVAMKLDPGVQRVELSGRLGNVDWRHSVSIKPVGEQAGIRIDWARKMIAQSQRNRYLGADEDTIRREVLDLALTHHLVSPYTSLVAVDVTPVRPSDALSDSKPVPPTRPAGLNIQLAQGATGFELSILLALMMASLGGWLLRTRARRV